MVDAESQPATRRRIVVVVLALLLILLPLYLWPVHIGSGGLPGLSALLGTVGDQRDPAAVARIPGDAWDVLMGGADAPPSLPPATLPPPNLTMIADPQELTGSALGGGPLDEDAMLVPGLIAGAGGSGDATEGWGAGGEAVGSSPPSSLLASHAGGGSGDGNGWSQFGGGYRDLGPGAGGGNPPGISSVPSFGPAAGGGNPPGTPNVPSFGPGDGHAVPTPTPEPATLILVGSNVALLGAAAWKRRRRRRGLPAMG